MLIKPKVTVLMPVYNCELYIREAVDSILNQFFSDFEFIIIDDCSNDTTVSILKTYQDSRINLILKQENTGYTNSLNYGLSIAKGEYIARMDGDDISLPERFSKQVDFLDKNQEYILCGTKYSILKKNSIINVPENNNEIRIALLSANCFGHPTVMMRKVVLDKLDIVYDSSKEPAEDYDLWVRLLDFGNLHNIQEVLLQYRVHEKQVSRSRSEKQNLIAQETKLNLLKKSGTEFSNSDESLFMKLLSNDNKLIYNDLFLFFDLKKRLQKNNIYFEANSFDRYLKSLEIKIVHKYFSSKKQFSPNVYYEYLKAKNNLNEKLSFFYEFKLFIKSLIFYKIK